MQNAGQNAAGTAAQNVIVIGAGMGGLAAAIRLAAAGCSVTLLEARATPGGKARAVPSVAGPVDAGPTVLTLRAAFDALFALAGQRLEDQVTLVPQPILARHWWPDGSTLDLHSDRAANVAAIQAFAGSAAARGFARFDAQAEALYSAFEGPVMLSARPDPGGILRAIRGHPGLWPALLPGVTLQRLLRSCFHDPRLVQLFARYATYVGGRPGHVPGVLALIWRAEARGVWAVEGGMHHLARALAGLAARLGVTLLYDTPAQRIVTQGGRVTGVQLEGGRTLPCEACVFNGDPGALTEGHLGDAARTALPGRATQPRSLSAHVWAFAATATGPRGADLIHHNVFFTARPEAEFGPIGQGDLPVEPSLYLCAEDRTWGTADPPVNPLERFEIIVNAPSGRPDQPQDFATCHASTFPRLQQMGLGFQPAPGPEALTTPGMLSQMFPGSQGAIYGRSPEGSFAAFQRPQARTGLPGLYLAGGGAHPGAGVPMAALSGRHAAEAIMNDRISRSPLRPTAMPGGTSTGFPTTGRAPSR